MPAPGKCSAGTPRMINALFVFSVPQYYIETKEVVRFFAANGAACRVVFGFEGELFDRASEECAALGIQPERFPPDLRYAAASGNAAEPPRRQQRADLERLARDRRYSAGRFVFEVRRIARQVATCRRALRYAGELLRSTAPDVVFSGPYHSCGRADNALGAVCRRRRIPYFCLSNTPLTGTRYAIASRFSCVEMGMAKPNVLLQPGSWIHHAIRRAFPDWFAEIHGFRLLPFVDYELLAAWLAGMGEPWPWQKPSLNFDLIFTQSAFADGMIMAPPSRWASARIRRVGMPRLDPVIAELNAGSLATRVRRTLNVDVPYVLLNIEPSFEHRLASEEEHRERMRILFGAAARCGSHVVVSLHPICDAPAYKELIAAHGFHWDPSLGIHELYPFARYAITFACSTNQFAAVFNVPLVIYDFENFLTDEEEYAQYTHGMTAFHAHDEETLLSGIRAAGALPPPQTSLRPESACRRIFEETQRYLSERRP